MFGVQTVENVRTNNIAVCASAHEATRRSVSNFRVKLAVVPVPVSPLAVAPAPQHVHRWQEQ